MATAYTKNVLQQVSITLNTNKLINDQQVE